MKKNGRKLNSGVSTKILIGRSGQNVVIQGNQMGQGQNQVAGMTQNNFKQNIMELQ
jgi:hypothetical protein